MRTVRPFIAALALAGTLVLASPATAKIIKTTRPSEYKELELTIGSGFEYEGDEEEKQYDYPFLIEYGITNALSLAIEPDYVVINRAGASSLSGLGDLETSVVYELVSERRSRPTFATEVLIKWPTATSDSLTTGEIDYSVGGIISKAFIHFELDSEILYTFVGDPAGIDLENTTEISLACVWHVTRALDVEMEGVTSSGGGFHGSSNLSQLPGDVTAAEGREYEITLGLAEQVTSHLMLEQGAVWKSDGAWQFVAAWEWYFGEGD